MKLTKSKRCTDWFIRTCARVAATEGLITVEFTLRYDGENEPNGRRTGDITRYRETCYGGLVMVGRIRRALDGGMTDAEGIPMNVVGLDFEF